MAKNETSQEEVARTDRRGSERDRRRKKSTTERRQQEVPVVMERRSGDDRRKGERRRQVDPTTCERDYTDEEIDFMKAMDQYKRANRRPFPTWSEVLEVLHALGYRRVEERVSLPGLPLDPKDK